MIWVVILIGVAALAGTFYYWKNKQASTIESGDAIKRDNDFFKQEHNFTTAITSITELGNAIDKGTLDRNKVSFEPKYENGRIFFHNQSMSGTFGATLKFVETVDDKFIYQFKVNAWREKSGIAYTDLIAANVLLTTIEKAVLSLDNEATISRKHATYTTKTKFM